MCEHLHIYVHMYACVRTCLCLSSGNIYFYLFVYSLETGFLHQKASAKGLHTEEHLLLASTGICMHVCIQKHSYNHISTNTHFYKHMNTKKRTPLVRTNKLKSQDSLLCDTQKWWPPNQTWERKMVSLIKGQILQLEEKLLHQNPQSREDELNPNQYQLTWKSGGSRATTSPLQMEQCPGSINCLPKCPRNSGCCL